ncbi:tRNA-uridine aminocarboxypropyltransferase [Pollutimonas bauzanensis]|nr:DTW domain-containing protein [Pollutimonas bauzanensis]
MSEQKSLSRPRCARCLRPMSHCLCAHITVAPNRTRILILQHPDEQKHPLNTARLAVLGLAHAELLVGEHFPQLNGIISAAASVFLLFPTKNAALSQPLLASRAGESSLLIVPDGTWRKARKIMHANPVLGALPRLSLPIGEPSEYRVRRAREPAAVSTIEAIVRALTVLEPERDFQPVLKPFKALVDRQIQAMGADLYRRNYSDRSPVR